MNDEVMRLISAADEVMRLMGEYALVVRVVATVLATAVVHFLTKRLLVHLTHQAEKTRNRYDDALFLAAERPLAWLIWVLGVTWGAQLLGGGIGAAIFSYTGRARDVGVIWVTAWFAVRFIRLMEDQVLDDDDSDRRMDLMTAKAIAKILRVLVLAIGGLLALHALGFTISGVLAFGGIGGVAVGFAARDMLANFFGALMIFMDRPFKVGDWIRSPDQEIEGTVEEIGWRLTRIRTFDQRPLYVPNSTFATLTVENPSRMLNRRIYETIGLRYDDISVMPDIVAEVESMLRNHPDIDQSVTLMVNFVTFGPSSVDFFVYTFTRTTVWQEYHAIKQDVLFKIAEIIERRGAEIAFPTNTVHLAEPQE